MTKQQELQAQVAKMRYRRKICNIKGITLNGKPAIIRGIALDFARITAEDGSHTQWLWSDIERVINHGGDFKS